MIEAIWYEGLWRERVCDGVSILAEGNGWMAFIISCFSSIPLVHSPWSPLLNSNESIDPFVG